MNKRFNFPALAAVTLAVTLPLATAAGAADNNVRIATNSPYKPMVATKPNGELTGFDVDLGNALCKEAELHCSWHDQAWDGLIPALMAHKADAIMGGMTINDQRKKHVRFSDTYLTVPSAFFVKSGSSLDKINKDSLKGKKIGVQRGTVQDNYISDKYGKVATVKRYQSADDVAVDMDAGRLDVAFFDQITGDSTLIKPNDGKYHQVGKELVKPRKYFGEGFGIAVRPSDKALAEKFNKALAKLKKDGTYDRIYRKYFHKKPSDKVKSAN